MNIEKLFVAAIFASQRRMFGGIPIEKLGSKARRQLTSHKRWDNRSTSHHTPNGARERSRRLAFKTKHGHFA